MQESPKKTRHMNFNIIIFQLVEMFGKISAQSHTTLCIQFLDREDNDKNNRLPLRKQICFTIVWDCAEILPNVLTTTEKFDFTR